MNTANQITDHIFETVRDHVYTDLLDLGLDNATAYVYAFGGGSILQLDEVPDFDESALVDSVEPY